MFNGFKAFVAHSSSPSNFSTVSFISTTFGGIKNFINGDFAVSLHFLPFGNQPLASVGNEQVHKIAVMSISAVSTSMFIPLYSICFTAEVGISVNGLSAPCLYTAYPWVSLHKRHWHRSGGVYTIFPFLFIFTSNKPNFEGL